MQEWWRPALRSHVNFNVFLNEQPSMCFSTLCANRGIRYDASQGAVVFCLLQTSGSKLYVGSLITYSCSDNVVYCMFCLWTVREGARPPESALTYRWTSTDIPECAFLLLHLISHPHLNYFPLKRLLLNRFLCLNHVYMNKKWWTSKKMKAEAH